jgi:hypothetical protein
MKIRFNLNTKIKNSTKKVILDNKMQTLVSQGREEFKKLIDKGISVPVALL